MVTEQKVRNKGGRKPGRGDSTIPWDEDNEIMDRLDQRAEYELAGLSRVAIMAALKISHDTFAQDTHRMKQRHARMASRSISALINARAADLEAAIKFNFKVAADPSTPPEIRVQATRAIQVLVKEDRELRRLSVPLGGSEQPQQAGGTTITQQNNTIITSAGPIELLELMRQQRVAHEEKMAAIDVSEEAQRSYFGSDNILPVGTRAAAHYGDDEPADDDDED